MSGRRLYKGELWVAPGNEYPTVLRVQDVADVHGRPSGVLALYELRANTQYHGSTAGPLTYDEATEKFGFITQVWRFASTDRDTDPTVHHVEDYAGDSPLMKIFRRIRDGEHTGPQGAR